MTKSKQYLTRMLLFIVAVLALLLFLHQPLLLAFQANPTLNGLIGVMLIVGIFFAVRRVTDLGAEVDWINAFRKTDGAVSSTGAPRLMAPAAAMMTSSDDGRVMRLSALSTRSVLDGIGARLEESREISRYFTGLLIFLGLLGTFWGLLGTISAIGETINSLSVDGGDTTLMFDSLKAGLEKPLSGMGTAFSSSLFGLAGSLILGFMDLQATQAQTRFYNDVEDWLSSVTQLSRGEEGIVSGASPSAYTTALMEQTAEGIDKLQRTLKRSEEDRRSLNDGVVAMAESLVGLSDKMAEQSSGQQQGLAQIADAQNKLAAAIDRLASDEQSTAPVLDDASRQHLRNVDIGLKRLAEEQSRSSEQMVDELRSELKLLSRTISAGIEASAQQGRELD